MSQPTKEEAVSESTEQDQLSTADQAERDRLMSKAYTTAQADLRKAHQDEFNGLYQKRCAEVGITWTPRKSKQDQALDTITELLSQYPDLGERLVERLSGQ
jgi:hypothetical protein